MAEREWTQDEIDEDMFRHEDDEDCACEQADFDLLEGRARCHVCGRSWYLTTEELKTELRFQAEHEELRQEMADEADVPQLATPAEQEKSDD